MFKRATLPFYDFDYNGVLFKTHGCSNIQQLCCAASGAFFVSVRKREKKGKGKEKLPHANIYTVISFNCTLLFNLPWTNAFKSRAGGILLKSCLVLDKVFPDCCGLVAWLLPT